MTLLPRPGRARPLLRAAALVTAGAALTVALGVLVVLGDLRFDGGRLIHVAMGSDALAESCRTPLIDRLAERGFQPDDVEFGPAPTLGPPWDRARTFGDSFTFRDGAGQVRVDGVVACAIQGTSVTIDFRVASNPHRDA